MNNYRFNYGSIRKTNIKKWFVSYYNQKFIGACKFHAYSDRGVSQKNIEAKGWEPNEQDKNYATTNYGKLEDWNTTIDKMVEFIHIWRQFNDIISEDEYKVKADELSKWLTDSYKQNDLYKWDDKLNYSGLEYENYEIFVDLYFRDNEGNPTLRYNVLDDEVYVKDFETNENVVFTKKNLRGILINYAKPLLKAVSPQYNFVQTIVDDIYDMNIRWEHRNIYAYDVLREYVDNLPVWDGVERAEEWFIKYQNAPDCSYVRHATFNWLFNALRNIYEPCKYPFLHMLVLKGETDCGKTATMEHLFKLNDVDRFTYNVKMSDDQSKIAAILRTVWALGFGERCGITKDDNNTQKQFMDTLNATIAYQKKFQNEVTRYKPHNCVYVSTNDDKLLNDYTVLYNKRYWIIPCNISAKEYQDKKYWYETNDLRDQLWAEIKYKYLQEPDKRLMLTDEDIEELVNIQKNFQTIDTSDVDFAVEELVGRKFTFNIIGKIKCLESEEDFIKQFNSNDCGPNAGLLNAFPASYINKWKKLKGFDSRMEKMIKNKFEELGWKYVSFRWNGSVTKGWKYMGDDMERTCVNGTPIDMFSV